MQIQILKYPNDPCLINEHNMVIGIGTVDKVFKNGIMVDGVGYYASIRRGGWICYDKLIRCPTAVIEQVIDQIKCRHPTTP